MTPYENLSRPGNAILGLYTRVDGLSNVTVSPGASVMSDGSVEIVKNSLVWAKGRKGCGRINYVFLIARPRRWWRIFLFWQKPVDLLVTDAVRGGAEPSPEAMPKGFTRYRRIGIIYARAGEGFEKMDMESCKTLKQP